MACCWQVPRCSRSRLRSRSSGAPQAVVAARHFRLGVATILVFYGGIASFYFVLGLHLQSTLGLSALQSGGLFAILGAAFFIASMSSAPLARLLKRPPVELGAL